MAEDTAKPSDAEEQEGQVETQPKKSKKKLIIIGAAVVSLLAAGGGGYFFFFKKKQENASGAGGEQAAAVSKTAVFHDLPEMVVNLGGSNRTIYLKIKVALEIGDPLMLAKITPFLPRVTDAFQTYMRELRPSDVEGSAGVFRLKEELLRRVNMAVYPAKVDAVLFKEFMLQ